MRSLRTENEIKDFIDSKKVITRNELSKFIYGYKDSTNKHRLMRWWEYTLKTKDWLKLREYAESKINRDDVFSERYQQFKKIYLTDPRLKTSGRRTTKGILEKAYGIDLCMSTVGRYIKKIRIENEKISN